MTSMRTRCQAVALIMTMVLAGAVALGADTPASAQAIGTRTVKKLGAPASQSFNIEVHEAPPPGAVVTNIVVPGGGESSAQVDAGAYVLSEVEVQDYVLEGWALVDAGESCPAAPTSAAELFNVSITEGVTSVVCVYNAAAEPPTGTLTVKKLGAPATQGFNVEVHEGSGLGAVVTNIIVPGGGAAAAVIEAGTYTLSELEVQDNVLAGWALASPGGVCPAAPTSTADLFTLGVTADATTVVCVYNVSTEPTTGTLMVKKLGAPATQGFNIEVHPAADLGTAVANIIVPGGGQASAQLQPGSYTLSELEVQDYVLEGWALAGTGGVCPDDPTWLAGLYTVSVPAGTTTVVCVYNTSSGPGTGTLTVKKVGPPPSRSFNVEVHEAANLTAVVTNIIVAGGGQASASVDAGSYTLSELEAQDYVLQGWALAGTNGICPASPTWLSGLYTISVTANATTVVCAYNTNAQVGPRVTLVSPSSGHTAGGLAVGIRGTGFLGATSVTFGGSPAARFEVLDDTTIVAVTAPHFAGRADVTVATAQGVSPNTGADDFTFAVMACPETPLWVNDLAYGSGGGGFYWDPVSGQVWTGERHWHVFSPQPPRPFPQPLWVNALTYGSAGGGFYWDPVSGQVWTAERQWHVYNPVGCIPR